MKISKILCSHILFRASWLEEEEPADKSWLKIKTLAFVLLSANHPPLTLFIISVTQTIQNTKNREERPFLIPRSFFLFWKCSLLYIFSAFTSDPQLLTLDFRVRAGESQDRLMDGHRNSEIFGHFEPLRYIQVSYSFYAWNRVKVDLAGRGRKIGWH